MQNPLQGILASFIANVARESERKRPTAPTGVPSPGLGGVPALPNRPIQWRPPATPAAPPPAEPTAPPPPPPPDPVAGMNALPMPDPIGGLGNIKDNFWSTAGGVKDDPGGALGAAFAPLDAAGQKVRGDVIGELSYRIANLDDKKQQALAIAGIVTDMAASMSPGVNNPVAGGSATQFIPDWKGVADGVQNFLTWSVANKDSVNEAHGQGGGAEVIKRFQEEQGLLSNFLFEAGTDPLNYIGAGGAALGRRAATMAPGLAADAVSGLGNVLRAPDLLTDAALGVAGKGVKAVGGQAKKAPGAATVVKWFETDPRTKARNTRNAIVRAIGQEDQAGVVNIPDPVGAPAPGVRPPDPGTTPEYVYTHNPRRAQDGSIAKGADAMQERLRSAAGDNTQAYEDALLENEDFLEMVASPDVKTNPPENWLAGFDTELSIRETGGTGPHINNHAKNSWGYWLDELAWNPDPAARDAARKWLRDRKAPRSGSKEAVEDAIQSAEQNPFNPLNQPINPAAPRYSEHLDLLNDDEKDMLDFGLKTPGPWRSTMQSADSLMRSRADEMLQAWDDFGTGKITQADAEFAEMGFRDASNLAQGMIEAFRRKAEYSAAYSMRNGTPLGPDYAAFVKASEEADRSVTMRGIISDESEDLLNQTFSGTNKTYAGRTFRDVARETRATIQGEKDELIELIRRRDTLGQPLDPKQLKRLQKLQEKYPYATDLVGVAKLNVDQVWKNDLNQQLRDHFDVKEVNRFWRGIDTLTSNFSTLNLLAPWSVGRYFIGNLAGDTLQVAMKLGLDSAVGMNFSEMQKAMMDYAVRGGDPLDSALGRMYVKNGLGGFNPATVDDNLTEAIFDRPRDTMRKAGGRSTFNVNTRMADWKYFKGVRAVSNGAEWGRRTALHGRLFEKNLIGARADYITENMDTLLRSNIGRDEADEIMEELGPHFSGSEAATAFGQRAMEKGASQEQVAKLANEMGRKWANKVNVADKEALQKVNSALFSYDTSNVDVWARRFVPFHMWATRALPFYAEQGMRNPGLINAYYSLQEETSRQAEEHNWPDNLKTYAKFWEGPGGIMMLFNPMAAVGLMDLALFQPSKENPYEDKNAIVGFLDGMSKFGLGLAPIWKSMLDYSGNLGDAPATDPFGFYQAYNFMRIQVQNGINQGWLGEEARGWMDRPYEEFLSGVRSVTSGLTSNIGIGEHIPAAYVEGGDLKKVQNQMVANKLAERGLTMDQYWEYVMQAGRNPNSAEAQWLDDIHQEVSDEFADAGEPYLRAVKEVSEGEAGAALWRSIVPGPKTTRQGTSLEIQSLGGAAEAYLDNGEDTYVEGLGMLPNAKKGDILDRVSDPYALAAHPELLDSRDREFLNNWVKMFGQDYRRGDLERLLRGAQVVNRDQNLTSEAQVIERQDRARDALGTKRERKLLQEYNKIAYGERDVKVKTGGRKIVMTAADLKAQEPAMARAIADVWLAEQDPTGEVTKLRDAKNLYMDTHPELAGWNDWQRGSRSDWKDAGGAAGYRANEMKRNDNYAAYIGRETAYLRKQGLSPSEIEKKLDDSITFSLEGYFAYQGKQWGLYDPAAVDTGDPSPLPPGAVGSLGGGYGGGGGGGGSSSSSPSWADRATTAIMSGHAVRREQAKVYGSSFDDMTNQTVAQYRLENAPADLIPGEDDWIYQDYVEWAKERYYQNEEYSVDTYIAVTSKEEDEDTLAELSPEFYKK